MKKTSRHKKFMPRRFAGTMNKALPHEYSCGRALSVHNQYLGHIKTKAQDGACNLLFGMHAASGISADENSRSVRYRYKFLICRTCRRRRAKLLSAFDSPLYQTELFKIPMCKCRFCAGVYRKFSIEIKVIRAVKRCQFGNGNLISGHGFYFILRNFLLIFAALDTS